VDVSAGGQLLDFKTGEIFINNDRAAPGAVLCRPGVEG
jgi:hypothetical protein